MSAIVGARCPAQIVETVGGANKDLPQKVVQQIERLLDQRSGPFRRDAQRRESVRPLRTQVTPRARAACRSAVISDISWTAR
jgi:hypothetical protein